MSDLIDREALLRQIDIDSEGEPGYYGDTWKFIDTIKSMPPAELGTNLAEVGTDCISRQAAIDAIDDIESEVADGFGFQYEKWRKHFEELPPAEPPTELKRGRWIKLDMHRGMADHKCTACEQECYVPTCMGEPMYAFCPNCGAEMRQREE